MTVAALARMAKTRWEADKEKGGEIVWCWKIKGQKKKKEGWCSTLKNLFSQPVTSATCSNGLAPSNPLGTVHVYSL